MTIDMIAERAGLMMTAIIAGLIFTLTLSSLAAAM